MKNIDQAATVTLNSDEVKNPVAEERNLIAKLLYDKIPGLTSDYAKLVRHTGGLLSSSMSVAYNRGLKDALMLILKHTGEPPKGE